MLMIFSVNKTVIYTIAIFIFIHVIEAHVEKKKSTHADVKEVFSYHLFHMGKLGKDPFFYI